MTLVRLGAERRNIVARPPGEADKLDREQILQFYLKNCIPLEPENKLILGVTDPAPLQRTDAVSTGHHNYPSALLALTAPPG